MAISRSLIISYCEYTDKDSFNLRKLLEYLLKFLDNQTEIVLVEQGFDKHVTWLGELPNNKKINHIFLQSYKIFNKGWGYNVGVKNARGEQIILHDTETYLRPKTYGASWMLNNFDIVKPYKNYINLEEDESNKYLINYNFNIILGKKVVKYNDISGGVLMINKCKFLSVKGFDETIVSYNYQKVAFDIKVRKLGLTINHYNDASLNVTKDNIFLSKSIFRNDKYICYLYNDLDTFLLNELINNIQFGLDEISKFDYDSFMLIEPISIIITAYQTQNYIEECLDSIENQTYFKYNNNFEVLLGIDACEETLNKVLQIKDKYRNLRVFMMKDNKGTYITSNTLVDIAKYENILRFDSDDVMYPYMVNTISYYIKKYNTVVFKFDNFKLVNGKDQIKKTNEKYAHGVLLINKKVLNELGGYQPWVCAADSELFVRGKDLLNIKIINKVLFKRRIHDGNLTRRNDVGLKSDKRKKYRELIGKHENVKIEKITNKYTEI
ncbi:MAG: glycosyltransferase [bacterium]